VFNVSVERNNHWVVHLFDICCSFKVVLTRCLVETFLCFAILSPRCLNSTFLCFVLCFVWCTLWEFYFIKVCN
jgi:hypothetical protein